MGKPLAVGDMKPEQERALLEIIRRLEEDKCALKRELDMLSAERELRRRPDGSNIQSRIIALITLHGGELRERVIARNFKHVMKTAEDRKAILREMVEEGTLTTRIGGKLKPGGWTESVYSIGPSTTSP